MASNENSKKQNIPSSGNAMNPEPQAYIGGPQHQGGLNGVKKTTKPGLK